MMTRRKILQFLGASSLLPLLPPLEARAQSAPAPKRFIVYYSSGGTVREQWLPQMSNGTLALSTILAPLEPYKSELLVVDGLGYNVVPGGLADGHYGALDASLTGTRPQVVDSSNGTTMATGISIDQAIANAVGASRPFRSLQCGIEVEMLAPGLDTISYAGSLQPLRPQNDPYAMYSRLFGSGTPVGSTDPAAEQRRLDRKSVLDFVTGDLARLKGMLGTNDRSRLDAHLDSVRQLETSLAALPASTCVAPNVSASVDINANDNIPTITKVYTDLLVAALACDLTRVATLQQGRSGAGHRHTWLGSEFLIDGATDGTTGVHGLAHNNANPVSRDKLTRCNVWYAQQLAYLWSRLKAIPEGNGTMADNTLVLWMNELGDGSIHSKTQIPLVMLGSLGGHFKTGQLVSHPGQAHNPLLVSIGQAFGLNISSFGDPAFNSGPLPGLT